MSITTTQAVLVEQSSARSNQSQMQIALFKADGTPHVVPSRAAAQADAAALTAAAAAGATPTDAEFDALLADVTALRTLVNTLLGKLRTANVIAT